MDAPKNVDLIAAFLDGDLIPAIILWRSGQYSFVIDGVHRLSAMLAWIYDDDGDRSRSVSFFNNQVPEEQLKLAEQTRQLVDDRIGTFGMYQDWLKNIFAAPEHLRKRLGNLANGAFVAQWVPAVDANGAQNSFFKINQAPTPIDPTEKRILKARESAVAIATRAINRGGTGHKYWRSFSSEVRAEIEELGHDIHSALYLPPLGGLPIKSSDVPVAGRGYSSLPFIFDLVTLTTGRRVKDSTVTEEVKESFGKDVDGSQTIKFLQDVRKVVSRITTSDPGSLGLHPIVYFCTRGGKFQPIAFLAVVQVVERLIEKNRRDDSINIRRNLEQFLMQHKEAFTLIVKSQGSGSRSRPAIEAFLEIIMQAFWDGKSEAEVLADLARDNRFRLLASPQPIREGRRSSGRFSASVKTAAFVAELATNGVKCGICGTLVHRNSMHSDHVVERSDGGGAHSGNAQITHPYCNTGYKTRRKYKLLALLLAFGWGGPRGRLPRNVAQKCVRSGASIGINRTHLEALGRDPRGLKARESAAEARAGPDGDDGGSIITWRNASLSAQICAVDAPLRMKRGA